ncbi:MAG: ribosome-binding factor A [Pseudomonadota bacterium]
MYKESNRPRRVAELIKRELALIIPRTLDHPLAHRITLTHAEAPRDMSSVKIYFTLLGAAAASAAVPATAPGVALPPLSMASSLESKEATKVLNHAAGFLRHALRGRVVLRAIPELRFHYDESVARGARLTSLIDQAIAEDKEHPHDE